jgi:serine protease
MKGQLALIGFGIALLVACGDTTKPPPPPADSGSVSGSLIFPGQVGVNPTPPSPQPPSPPTGGTISGTVAAPSGGSITGTTVLACVGTTAANADCDDPASQSVTITATGASAPYSFSGLTSTSYIALAGKDVNGDGRVNAGDYVGCFGGAPNCQGVQPPRASVNIQMTVVTSPSSADLRGLGSAFARANLNATLNPVMPGFSGVVGSNVNRSSQPAPMEFVPGDVILKFRGGVRPQSVGALQVRVGSQNVGVNRVAALGAALPGVELYKANVDAAGTLALVAQLTARADVEYAEVNQIYRIKKVPNDPLYALQWHYRAMNLEAAWNITDGTTGAPVTVAVVDTGSVLHPELQGVFLGGYDFVSSTARSGDGDGRDPDPTDQGGDSGYHGSHVAGTIAARTNNGVGVAGVNWGARVVPVRVLGTDGGGTFADILAGTQWAAGISVPGVPDNPNPAKVINLSLGGSRDCSQAEQQLFDAIKAKGVITVVAAGNENVDVSNSAPANCQNVITIGATGPTNTRAPYSNYGSRIDLMAPGGDTEASFTLAGDTYPAGVLSTLLSATGSPSFGFYQGTSMATPHVAGLVSLMLAKDPGLGFDTVLARLKAASTPLSAADCNRPSGAECGAGLVDAARALSATNGGNPPPPTPPAPPPPPTANLKTYVAALRCAQGSNCTVFDEQASVLVQVQATRSQVPFQLTGLGAGTYIAAGWQDTNGNSRVDAGEPFGANGPFTIAANQALSGLVIRMQPAVVSNAPANITSGTAPRLERTVAALLRR